MINACRFYCCNQEIVVDYLDHQNATETHSYVPRATSLARLENQHPGHCPQRTDPHSGQTPYRTHSEYHEQISDLSPLIIPHHGEASNFPRQPELEIFLLSVVLRVYPGS